MPLETGKSKAAFKHNVEVEVAAGKPQNQAVAIAYSKQREARDAEVEISPADIRKHIATHRRIQELALEGLEVETEDTVPTVDRKPLAFHVGSIQELDSAPRLAMDRAPTARTKDPINGWLHIKDCRISKANVCPYVGKEIPDSEKLGLEKDRVYYLYRDAAALEAAAKSFERAPLMLHHVAVTAQQPNKDKIIGAISNVRWQAPYLVADLTVWDGDGIEAIESERQQELSPGYYYKPQMNSGVAPDGDRFDGRMLDIRGNHLAIVDTGRTGPDVVVADAAPTIS